MMLTDIEIAQQAKMLPIHEIAKKLGILEEELESATLVELKTDMAVVA